MGAAHMRASKSGRRTARDKRAAARFADSADPGLPQAQGLYDPALEKDSCGVGFIADIKGRSSHKLIEDALAILCNLEHRGAVGADRVDAGCLLRRVDRDKPIEIGFARIIVIRVALALDRLADLVAGELERA